MQQKGLQNMKIYMIMVATKCSITNDKLAAPDFGGSELVGYYSSKEEAFNAVHNNRGDMYETLYDYAIIEEVEEGLYPCSMTRWFFKFNSALQKYEDMKEPDGFSSCCGLVV